MSVILDKNSRLTAHVQACLEDDDARRMTYQAQAAFEQCRKAQCLASEAWEEHRTAATAMRDEVLAHLAMYWQQFADNATSNGLSVHDAESAAVAQRMVQAFCQEKETVRVAAAGLAEEIDCRNILAEDGVSVVEGERADVVIVDGQMAVAENGAVGLLEDACLAGGGAETLIVLIGREAVLPTMAALETVKQAAACTAMAHAMTLVTTPDAQGVRDIHIVVVDNGRSAILESRYQAMLRCVRCGACLHVCPVVRHITGRGYGTCYEGPMGIMYSTLLNGWDTYTKDLPFACTLCGACDEVCPVNIPLGDLILARRRDIVEGTDLQSAKEEAFYRLSGFILARPALYGLSTAMAKPLMRGVARLTMEDNHLGDNIKLPLVHYWTGCRNMPLLRSGEFRWWFEEQHRMHDE